MNTYSVNVGMLPSIYQIGQKLYVVRECLAKGNYQTKCPVCDDEKKITYRGYEMPCPYCAGQYNDWRSEKPTRNSINMHKYIVEEFIVFSVLIKGPDYMSSYQPRNANDAKNLPRVRTVEAFHRDDNGYNGIRTITVPDGINLDPSKDRLSMVTKPSVLAFTTKQKAREAAEFFKEKEKKRLAEFNEKFGCNFEYPEDE